MFCRVLGRGLMLMTFQLLNVKSLFENIFKILKFGYGTSTLSNSVDISRRLLIWHCRLENAECYCANETLYLWRDSQIIFLEFIKFEIRDTRGFNLSSRLTYFISAFSFYIICIFLNGVGFQTDSLLFHPTVGQKSGS